MRLLPLLLLLVACPPLKQARPDDDGDGADVDIDCDDADPAVAPGLRESCDGLDNDCDGEVDEGAADAGTRYPDADADGYGDAAGATAVCADIAGYSAESGDCDDTDAAISPVADERCNTVDDDCDGETDEPDAIDASTTFGDGDNDGHGDANRPETACTHSAGMSTLSDDCDDNNPEIYPGVLDICDGVNQDCDNDIDEDATDLDWYPDDDGDGFGDDVPPVTRCEVVEGWVTLAGDCHDDDPRISPAAPETCDGVDEDCDGSIDDGVSGGLELWPDLDLDGYGDPGAASVLACATSPGLADNADDCDDSNSAVAPDQLEICDGQDNDCDGDTDTTAVDVVLFYLDQDGDGWGDTTAARYGCVAEPGETAVDGDCDDSNATVSPSALEVCDNADTDEDCDGLAEIDDPDVTGAGPWYTDADLDGHGAGSGTLTCDPGPNVSDNADDCDDTTAAVSPSTIEICDGDTDEDCDGLVDIDDPSVSGLATWYTDLDTDGYGQGAPIAVSCTNPGGAVTLDGDCDDSQADINPAAAEQCDPLDVDEDCDGLADDSDPTVADATVWYADLDLDGYGAGAPTQSCDPVSPWSATADDCDDGSSAVRPGETERCNGVDDDCDPATLEDGLVTADGTTNYTTIQDSINAAAVSVAICAGTWPESLRISHDLTLVGHGAPVIDGSVMGGPTLEINTTTVSLTDLTLSGGTGRDLTGDGAYEGGNLLLAAGSASLSGVTLQRGAADYGGGAWTQTGTSLVLEDCVIQDNTASYWGGGVNIGANASLDSTGGSWSNNRAVYGGALTSGTEASLTLSGDTLSSNTATDGGGVYLAYGVSARLTDVSVVENNAASGAGIYGYQASLAATGLTLTDNVATSQGGGLYAQTTTLDLSQSTVTGNVASDGGGLYTLGGTTTFSEVDVVFNEAIFGGGHVAESSSASFATLSFTDSDYAYNVASGDVGGLYLGIYAYLTADGGSFRYNDATNGGAVYLSAASSAFFAGTEVHHNTASSAAGLYLDSGAYAELNQGTLLSNTASIGAGGALVRSSASLYTYNTDLGTPGLDDNSPEDVYTTTSASSWSWTGLATIYCTSGC